MSGGSSGSGGGFSPPIQDNSLELAQLQFQQQQQAQADADAKADAAHKAFFVNEGTAQQNALASAKSLITNKGLDPAQYMPYATQAINDETNRIPLDDPNPAHYFTDDLINNALTGQQTNVRTGNQRDVNKIFSPGFEASMLPDSLTSPYINNILSTQRQQANNAISGAEQRGQLTDSGIAGAKAALGTQDAGATSTLSNLGTAVLGKDRGNLDTFRDQATTAANDWTLGDPNFNVGTFEGQAHDAANAAAGNVGGDLTNALGGTQLYDVNKILLAGGQSQGPQNLTTASVPGAPVKKNPLTDRGLGSAGAF